MKTKAEEKLIPLKGKVTRKRTKRKRTQKTKKRINPIPLIIDKELKDSEVKIILSKIAQDDMQNPAVRVSACKVLLQTESKTPEYDASFHKKIEKALQSK